MTESTLKQLIASMKAEQSHRLAFKQAWALETFDLLKRVIYEVFGNDNDNYALKISGDVIVVKHKDDSTKCLSIRFNEDRTKLEFDAYEDFQLRKRKCQWYEYHQEMTMMMDVAEACANV